jgi:membrane protein YdbS with pleckstrin-like domain
MNMSQAQDRNEAAEEGIEHITGPLVSNEHQEPENEIAPADQIEGEPIIWQASPSQWTRLGTYTLSIVLAIGAVALGAIYVWLVLLLFIPAAVAGWTYLNVRARVYELTTERLRLYSGVLDRNIEEIELYRIKDSTIDKPFQLRIFGLGNVQIVTSDRSRPSIQLHGIPDSRHVRNQLRHYVEQVRDDKGVREVDFEGGMGE